MPPAGIEYVPTLRSGTRNCSAQWVGSGPLLNAPAPSMICTLVSYLVQHSIPHGYPPPRSRTQSAGPICQAVLMPIALALSALTLAAWFYLLAGRGGFWRTDQRLPGGTDPPIWPSVVAVVPARDEADMLPQTLPTLLCQQYEGQFAVLLIDDESRDGTGEVARHLGRSAGGGLSVLGGEPLPDGWAGKVWAMAQGVRAAG